MRILVTGSMGYVGPGVVAHLRARFPEAELIGLDSGLFATCLTTPGRAPETRLDAQRFGDVRDVTVEDLRECDVVIHLAALSNDPIGTRFEEVTDAVNRAASLHLAACAREAGVGHFVFASSCSVYGFADAQARRETDATAPLTAYARSKIGTEEGLRQMDLNGMTVTCLRFATACGYSERLRLDLVLNDFVACALASGRITVLSDGTPWRPLIDVRDMARAIEWAATRDPARGGRMLVVNAGSDERNHQVRDLAVAVAQAVPGTTTEINTAAPFDPRSYRVDFGLFRALAPEHQPRCDLGESIAGLVTGLRGIGFDDAAFRGSAKMIRLNMVSALLAEQRLGPDLRWT
ncbi:nucleoside-diphosphate-sugar epimerase [Humitalea rosea]|uniref:Nucleoside-diphosphate-sugar epimerase n=1 Tax=Humitalea rosea TaxID=990373 RepID=A0A2W7I1V3_9PROT|nr:SDR family oxidoreductase [Humitalea rosea]PZW40806.1 nucleoside-diphosphate-sugar epimerase [Humitalea rosea]